MATADRSPGIIGHPLANTVPSSTCRSGALSVAVASSLLFLHPCPLAEWWTSLPVGICSHLLRQPHVRCALGGGSMRRKSVADREAGCSGASIQSPSSSRFRRHRRRRRLRCESPKGIAGRGREAVGRIRYHVSTMRYSRDTTLTCHVINRGTTWCPGLAAGGC